MDKLDFFLIRHESLKFCLLFFDDHNHFSQSVNGNFVEYGFVNVWWIFLFDAIKCDGGNVSLAVCINSDAILHNVFSCSNEEKQIYASISVVR